MGQENSEEKAAPNSKEEVELRPWWGRGAGAAGQQGDKERRVRLAGVELPGSRLCGEDGSVVPQDWTLVLGCALLLEVTPETDDRHLRASPKAGGKARRAERVGSGLSPGLGEGLAAFQSAPLSP